MVFDVGFGLTQFFALIKADRPLQRQQQRRRQTRHRVLRTRVGPACDMADHVMVGKGPAGPSVRGAGKEPFHPAAEMRGGEQRAQHVKAVGHVQAVLALRVFGHHRDGAAALADFADHRAVIIAVQQGTYPLQEPDVFRPGLGIEVILHVIGIDRGLRIVARLWRVGPQMLVMEIVVHRVQPEPVDPAIQPEAHRLQQPVLHQGIVKVEIRLAWQEVVQVILPAPRVPFPG